MGFVCLSLCVFVSPISGALWWSQPTLLVSFPIVSFHPLRLARTSPPRALLRACMDLMHWRMHLRLFPLAVVPPPFGSCWCLLHQLPSTCCCLRFAIWGRPPPSIGTFCFFRPLWVISEFFVFTVVVCIRSCSREPDRGSVYPPPMVAAIALCDGRYCSWAFEPNYHKLASLSCSLGCSHCELARFPWAFVLTPLRTLCPHLWAMVA